MSQTHTSGSNDAKKTSININESYDQLKRPGGVLVLKKSHVALPSNNGYKLISIVTIIGMIMVKIMARVSHNGYKPILQHCCFATSFFLILWIASVSYNPNYMNLAFSKEKNNTILFRVFFWKKKTMGKKKTTVFYRGDECMFPSPKNENAKQPKGCGPWRLLWFSTGLGGMGGWVFFGLVFFPAWFFLLQKQGGEFHHQIKRRSF